MELCAHNKPTQPDQDYDALISINLPSPLQETWMTDCNRKEFATINKPARSKCQSKCSNTVVSHYSNSQFQEVCWDADDIDRFFFSLVVFLALGAPCDFSPRSVFVPKESTGDLPQMSPVKQWGLIRTWSIIIRRPVSVTLKGSINLALQRWYSLQYHICSRNRGFASYVLQKYMTEKGCITLQHCVSEQVNPFNIFMFIQTHFWTY